MKKKILSAVITLMAMTACTNKPAPITEQFKCDDGNRFTLTHTPGTSAPATLTWQGKTYEMVGIKTKTGAERYEHPSGMTYIGAANSSMLIDRKQGKLIVQDCRNPSQEKTQKNLVTQRQ
ncbi:MAG: hypothetical protein KIG68_06685 [Oxalobacter sp.]|nr:hypothetical protein [Oxalobacter sp.]